jgi:hypothetical protein
MARTKPLATEMSLEAWAEILKMPKGMNRRGAKFGVNASDRKASIAALHQSASPCLPRGRSRNLLAGAAGVRVTRRSQPSKCRPRHRARRAVPKLIQKIQLILITDPRHFESHETEANSEQIFFPSSHPGDLWPHDGGVRFRRNT